MKSSDRKNIESQDSANSSGRDDLSQAQATASNAIKIPEISLPKGGGALKGIDEKFEVNAANGTSGFTIPLPLTSGRKGFSPDLALSYNSGSGNGPYGLGWSIGYPMIQRRTDKNIPRYRSGKNEDVFVFSGAEDLVPYLEKEGSDWIEKEYENNGVDGYTVRRYRPRIEGGFARIEKIKHSIHGEYWKVTTSENVATIYGRSKDTRIANPDDDTQVFQWMPEFSYDDKGNWIKFEYKKEDLVNVPNFLYEKNRLEGNALFTNLYLKRIKYGNRKAYYAFRPNQNDQPYDPRNPEDSEHFFESVFDYGEHDQLIPTPQEDEDWYYRPDAYSAYRSGFEIRTNRLCKRVLMFHHFKNEKQFVGSAEEEDFGVNYLVRSLDLEYKPSSINESGQAETVYLSSITESGYVRKPNGNYSKKSLPPIEFTYEKLNWNKTIKTVSQENLVNAPAGLSNDYQWVDLYSEGISGMLTEQGEGWFYKSNHGNLGTDNEIAFSEAKKVIPKPSFTGLFKDDLSLQDLASNGEKQIVVNLNGVRGYFELSEDYDWKTFKPFDQIVNINFKDPNTRFIDLNGDGKPDLLITEENVFEWYASDGKQGHLPVERAIKSFDEEQGPAILFADQEQVIFLADMSGDGLTDIARIRNGEICYWANKGYGSFSAKVNMSNAPLFDHDEVFNPKYLHIADVSGTGASDLIYLGKNKFQAFINLSGNAWSDVHEIEPSFPIDKDVKFSVIDLLGTGTSCIVWSSDLPAHTSTPMRYIDLMSSKKPHVLIHYKNNLGKETSIEYKSSTSYYLKDKLAGKPWITKLPFAVQVVSKMIVEEKITDVRFSSEYIYHHGYYDGLEREFRGFGMVEQIDSEKYEEWKSNNLTNQLEKSEAFFQKPVHIKTWFHTGAFLDKEKILTQFSEEYWYEEYNRTFPQSTIDITEPALPEVQLNDVIMSLDGDEFREALRACKGMMLRQEIFTLDAPDNPTEDELKLQMKPYSVGTHNCNIQLLQAREENGYGVFLVTESETIKINYERDETDYRIAHTLNTKIDELGNILESASIVYGRNVIKANAEIQLLSQNITDFSEDVLDNDPLQKSQLKSAFTKNVESLREEQIKTHITYKQNRFSKYKQGVNEHDDIDLPHVYRLRLQGETRTYELTDLLRNAGGDVVKYNNPQGQIYLNSEIQEIFDQSTAIEYHLSFTDGREKRLIEHIKTIFLRDELEPLEFGFFDTIGLSYENYQLAYTADLIQDIYSDKNGFELSGDGQLVSNLIKTQGNFTEFNNDGKLWIRSGIIHIKEDQELDAFKAKERFYSPIAFEDPFSVKTFVNYDVETFTNGIRNNDGYFLFVRDEIDEINNKTQISVFNYRTMIPARTIDINANPTSILLDELGFVKAMAIEGNGIYTDASITSIAIQKTADNLNSLKEYFDETELNDITQFYNSSTNDNTNTNQLRLLGNKLLHQASVRYVYDYDAFRTSAKQPSVVSSIVREEHFEDNNTSKLQFNFEYSDGLGNVVMTKVQAEPGEAFFIDENGIKQSKNTGQDLRWVGNGRTVLNNKGNPIREYEPFFSTNFQFEESPDLVELGVSTLFYYDPLGRLIKTIYPDGTLSRFEFDSWKQKEFDQNDTVEEKECIWYLRRTDNSSPDFINDVNEQNAAIKAEKHANTPTTIFLDSLGRSVLNVTNNGLDIQGKERLYTTFTKQDIEDNIKAIIDARGNSVVVHKHNIQSQQVYQKSMESGERWVLTNVLGNPIYRWDSREHVFIYGYDLINRLISMKVEGGEANASLNHIFEFVEYGENKPDQYLNNLRGEIFKQYDDAGRIQYDVYDFKGNLLENSRQFRADYKETANWTLANRNNPVFDADLTNYTTRITYDALSREVQTVTPDSSITTPIFNDAGLLDQVKIIQGNIVEKIFVKNIDYDAKGQRVKIIYGDRDNNTLATTSYNYDIETYRLIRLKTVYSGGKLLQDLHYTYDPSGNITEIRNKAIPVKFFNNQKIEGTASYEYDALYQLIKASGREHAGQAINFGLCDNWKDKSFLKSHSNGDDMAMRTYTEKYKYDPAGNILTMDHDAIDGKWKRNYTYEANNNRILNTKVGNQTYNYSHHSEHGYIDSLPHLSRMDWNHNDELQAVSKQVICNDNNPSETTYYVYDFEGNRVRKVTENIGGNTKKEERLYLGVVEIYIKHTGSNSGLERTSLHIMDDTKRIGIIDSRNAVDDNTESRTVRIQFADHLGSSVAELNDVGETVSYEEFHPYGTTSYQAVNKDVRIAAKRYRYTGMERDNESGLNYHSARYYIVWLGRWLSTDPIGIEDGYNLYAYVSNDPINFNDKSGTDKLTKYKSKVGKFSKKEINDAIITVFGEISATAPKDSKEAIAVASTIFNRLEAIQKTRKVFKKAEKKYNAAKTKVKEASADVTKANKEYEVLTRNESKEKRKIRDAIKGKFKDRKAREAEVKKRFDQKVKDAKAKITEEKKDLSKAKSALKKAFKGYEKARDAKIAAESYVAESKRDKKKITLSDIVEQHSQYEGTRKGTRDFDGYKDMSKKDKARNEKRFKIAKSAVLAIARGGKKDDYVQFRSNRKGKRVRRKGEVRIGGNDFWNKTK